MSQQQEPQRDGGPVLAGFIERRTKGVAGPPALLLRVWCGWCCTWHTHGLANAEPGDYTHRVGHCYAPDSEYNASGYWIFVTKTRFSRARTLVRKATTNQRYAIQDGRISTAVQRLRDQPLPIG
jgi:hypothetical protein